MCRRFIGQGTCVSFDKLFKVNRIWKQEFKRKFQKLQTQSVLVAMCYSELCILSGEAALKEASSMLQNR